MSSRSSNNNNNKRKEQQNNVVVSSKKGRRSIREEEPEESQEPDQTEDFPMTQAPTEEQQEQAEGEEEEQQQQVEGEAEEEPPLLESMMEPETPADQPVQEGEPQRPVKMVTDSEVHRTDNAEMNRNLLEEFNQAATTSTAAAADDDAMMLEALKQVENGEVVKSNNNNNNVEEETKHAVGIFETAQKFDEAYHNNLYFRNPNIENAICIFKKSVVTKNGATNVYENIKILLPEGIQQRFENKDFWNFSTITPPGLIEMFNPPPFGNISKAKCLKNDKPKDPNEKENKYDPANYSDCKWSLNYTSKHFYTNEDRDLVEYDRRTRRAYANAREKEAKAEYMKQHPEIDSEYSVPEEAYAFVQDSALSREQLETLGFEKIMYNSREVNSFFMWYKKKVEDMYFAKVRSDITNVAPKFKGVIEKAIRDDVANGQKTEDEKAAAEKRRPARILPEKFEVVMERKIKSSSIKYDSLGGVNTMSFGGKLFRAATLKDKEGLKNGTIVCSSAQITKICKENGLMENYFPIYRILTKSDDPEADPLQLMSVAEACKLVHEYKGNCIGQVVFSPGPFMNEKLSVYCRPEALIIWGPANAYREMHFGGPRKSAPRPAVTQRVYAPAHLNNNTSAISAIDTSGFGDMEIPAAFEYKKKDEKKEEGAAATAAAAK